MTTTTRTGAETTGAETTANCTRCGCWWGAAEHLARNRQCPAGYPGIPCTVTDPEIWTVTDGSERIWTEAATEAEALRCWIYGACYDHDLLADRGYPPLDADLAQDDEGFDFHAEDAPRCEHCTDLGLAAPRPGPLKETAP